MITDAVRRKCRPEWLADGSGRECGGCTRSFRRHGAAVSLSGAPGPHLLVDLDKIPYLKSRTRCDFVFFVDDADDAAGSVVPIEMTSGSWKDIGRIVEQLQAGADLAAQVVPRDSKPVFLPVFVGKTKRLPIRQRKAPEIRFRNERIVMVMCPNGPILEALE